MNIKLIHDNGGRTFDRYTVVFDNDIDGLYECLNLSPNPDWPQGVSMWDTVSEHWLDMNDIDPKTAHKELKFHELPVNVQRHVVIRMSEGD